MASLIPGYEYDIFISYRQKDNKHGGWVTEFVNNLKGELESTFKEEISVYFDINPHDGLLETHDVDASLKDKLKCLIFIPIISRTYCDPKSFAWEHEFKSFVKQASQDQFGLKVKLPNGNVASRVLPVRIHDLDNADIKLYESVLGSVLRGIEFIYKEPGVNRPITIKDNEEKNLNKTNYRNQINKVALAIKDIITAIEQNGQKPDRVSKEVVKAKPEEPKTLRTKIIIASFIALILILLGYFFIIPKLSNSSRPIEKSIAILPFVNLSNDPEQEYFSDGMVDAILNHLFKVGDLKVISRTSSMRYKNTKLTIKGIAHELNVSALLEGSVQKIGNNVRITAQLIDAKTDAQLWSETYDKDLSDVFSIQSEVAQNVARELKAKLTLKETQLLKNTPLTTNQLAYDFYLKGNDYWSKLNVSLAFNMYSKAIQEDSLFAAAYAKRAEVYSFFYWTKNEELHGCNLKAKKDIKKSMLLNPESPEVKLAQVIGYYYLDSDYDNALKNLKELKTEAPNMADLYAYSSYILRRQGKWEESISEAKRSIQMDPFNANYIDNLSHTYKALHKYNNEIEYCREGLSLIPDYKDFNYLVFYAYLDKTADLKVAMQESGLKKEDVQYLVYYYTRQYDKLIELISTNDSKFNIEYNNEYLQGKEQYSYHRRTYDFALIYYLSGNKSLCKVYSDSAITQLKDKIKEDPNDERFYSILGKSYALIGNNIKAVECGKKAVNMMPINLDANKGVNKEQDLMEIYIFTGNYDLALDKIEYLLTIPSQLSVGKLIIDPKFDNLRSFPRFKKIISSVQKKQNGS